MIPTSRPGYCEVCGKKLSAVGLSRCSAHAMAKPAHWTMTNRKPVERASDLDEQAADVEAQRA